MLLVVRNLMTNLPVQTSINCEPCDCIPLLLNQRRVILHPFRHGVRRCDEIVEVIDVEIPHHTAKQSLQFLVPFARSLVQHLPNFPWHRITILFPIRSGSEPCDPRSPLHLTRTHDASPCWPQSPPCTSETPVPTQTPSQQPNPRRIAFLKGHMRPVGRGFTFPCSVIPKFRSS
jgi:hypothetical protein